MLPCRGWGRACPETPYSANVPVSSATRRPPLLEIPPGIPSSGWTPFARTSGRVATKEGFRTCSGVVDTVYLGAMIVRMSTVTIPKIQYQELKKKAEAYEYISRIVEGSFFTSPSVKSAKTILSEFKKTGKYNAIFLKSLKNGLRRSSYFTK